MGSNGDAPPIPAWTGIIALGRRRLWGRSTRLGVHYSGKTQEWVRPHISPKTKDWSTEWQEGVSKALEKMCGGKELQETWGAMARVVTGLAIGLTACALVEAEGAHEG